MNRRERRRAETIAEIKRAALTQLRDEGPGSLSLRGVARAIGMSPAGLYRYYDGLDELITDLVTDAYQDLAAAVETEVDASADSAVRTRLRRAATAYRRWCLEHPNRFHLVFGTPIPGYTAPEGGPTSEAVVRMGLAFARVVADAVERDELELETTGLASGPEVEEFSARSSLPPAALDLLLGLWAAVHGPVSLELGGHITWAFGDPDAWFDRQIHHALDGLLEEPIRGDG